MRKPRRHRDWAAALSAWALVVGLAQAGLAGSDAGSGSISVPVPESPQTLFLDLFTAVQTAQIYPGVSGDGNNEESSSEALAAWTAIVLLGEIRGDRALRDTGMYLYASELAAVEAYWFDVNRQNFPARYPHPVVPTIWGGKGAYSTYFSQEPEALYGINWLPFHGGSLYLGRYPEFATRSYDALVAARGGTHWKMWSDLVVMYRALTDPADAERQWHDLERPVEPEAGNSRSNVALWLSIFRHAGPVDRSVSADTPLYAAFRDAEHRTYVAYNAGGVKRMVHFSDGASLAVEPGAFGILDCPDRGPCNAVSSSAAR